MYIINNKKIYTVHIHIYLKKSYTFYCTKFYIYCVKLLIKCSYELLMMK